MTDWVRLWHDMPTDPKWRVIARKSGQPLACVIAVFNLMMVSASQNAEQRGVMLNWDDEDAGAALDMDAADVAAIRQAMQGKVLDGESLTGWDKRQPKREDGTAAQRKAAWKEREEAKRNATERNGTQRNAPKTDADAETDSSVAKATGAAAPSDRAFWEAAKGYLGGKGSLIGKWSRDYGKPETARAITAAQLERAADPVSYIEAVLRKGARADAYQPIC